MDNTKNIIDGYEFESFAVYEEAKKEAETIAALRAHANLNDIDTLRKIYENYTGEDAFKTQVGIGFIREVQRRVAKDPEYKKRMKAIPVASRRGASEISDARIGELERKIKDLRREKKRDVSVRNIVIIFLAVVVAVLFYIEIYDGRAADKEKVREEVLNEYAGWADELTEREEYVRELERQLGIEQEDGDGQD